MKFQIVSLRFQNKGLTEAVQIVSLRFQNKGLTQAVSSTINNASQTWLVKTFLKCKKTSEKHNRIGIA